MRALKRQDEFTAAEWAELRSFCELFSIPEDAISTERHRHKCSGCGTIWTHSGAEAGMTCMMIAKGDTGLKDPHACPKCGLPNSKRHQGDRLRV